LVPPHSLTTADTIKAQTSFLYRQSTDFLKTHTSWPDDNNTLNNLHLNPSICIYYFKSRSACASKIHLLLYYYYTFTLFQPFWNSLLPSSQHQHLGSIWLYSLSNIGIVYLHQMLDHLIPLCMIPYIIQYSRLTFSFIFGWKLLVFLSTSWIWPSSFLYSNSAAPLYIGLSSHVMSEKCYIPLAHSEDRLNYLLRLYSAM